MVHSVPFKRVRLVHDELIDTLIEQIALTLPYESNCSTPVIYVDTRTDFKSKRTKYVVVLVLQTTSWFLINAINNYLQCKVTKANNCSSSCLFLEVTTDLIFIVILTQLMNN